MSITKINLFKEKNIYSYIQYIFVNTMTIRFIDYIYNEKYLIYVNNFRAC